MAPYSRPTEKPAAQRAASSGSHRRNSWSVQESQLSQWKDSFGGTAARDVAVQAGRTPPPASAWCFAKTCSCLKHEQTNGRGPHVESGEEMMIRDGQAQAARHAGSTVADDRENTFPLEKTPPVGGGVRPG